MSTVVSSVKLHLNKRETTLLVPLYITALVALVSVLISLFFLRSGSVPGSAIWVESSRYNPGLVYALAGFLGYLGVQSVGTTFPFALTLGATRRAFTGGTLVWAAIMSAYLTVVFAVLMLIEKATGHWFSNFYIFDVNVLGAGDLTRLVPIVFLGTLTLLTLGGAFAAAWVRFGSRGPVALAVCVVLVLIVALIIVIPSMPAIVAAFQLWWLAVAAIVVVALSAAGSWLMLRSAIVR
ncbi:hypothetical protein [Rathayibacter soli]|uniref:hypothetical protein n=1 Tax=Rathayibacter soli TaxID=3144168 RepID=UPI0027E5488C|nr:hypothetical protein [Glaciibacter superstes]